MARADDVDTVVLKKYKLWLEGIVLAPQAVEKGDRVKVMLKGVGEIMLHDGFEFGLQRPF